MAKKSNPDKGLRTVNIEFAGKNRQLKFTHSAVGDFEQEANRILRLTGVVTSGMVFADGIMATDLEGVAVGYIGNAKVLSLALFHCLKHEDNELSLQTVDKGIDDYILSGGSKLALVQAVIEAYRVATDPSSLAFLKRNWQILDGRKKILTEAENQKIEIVEKALADAMERLTHGSPSSDLPESS